MATALDLSEKELSELKDLTKENDPSAALRLALAEYIRYAKRMRLKEMSGQVEMQDNWREEPTMKAVLKKWRHLSTRTHPAGLARRNRVGSGKDPVAIAS